MLFNEKAEKLQDLNFTKYMFQQKSGVIFSGERVSEDSNKFVLKEKVIGPKAESIDAFVLTFRFFYQNNEISSINNLAKAYTNLNISNTLKNDFHRARIKLNKYLDDPTQIKIVYNERTLIRREILDIFVYGGLAHANKKKKAVYDSWKGMVGFWGIVQNQFHVILVTFFKYVNYFKNLNYRVIKEID